MIGQDSEFRKLQVTGGSTIIVSLPKEWVKSNDLKKGDVVSLEELASGDLRLSPLQGPAMKQVVSLDCCTYETGLIDLMIGAYLSGADVIRITEKLIKNKTVPALSALIFEISDMKFNSQIFLAYRALAYSTTPQRS